MEYFNIIQSICRISLINENSAILNQINRLIKALEKDGNLTQADSLTKIIQNNSKSIDIRPSKIEQAKVNILDKLKHNTPLPVDKETSTPLAEIIFPDDDIEKPKFNAEIEQAIDSLIKERLHAKELRTIGLNPINSCLLYGAPGTGKTHLAYWIANQLQIPIVLVKLDGIMSSFLGSTSKNIGNLFNFANKYHCLLLLDEFDAIAKLRDDIQEIGEIKRVVNSLLQSLDKRAQIGITLGITNHPDLLDPAIWRRFDIQVEIPNPSKEVIIDIIKKYTNPLELNSIELDFLGWLSEGSTGADIINLCNFLKKSNLIDDRESILAKVRKYIILNSGRLNKINKELISDNDALINSLEKYGLKQKEIAYLFGLTPSNFTKFKGKLKN